MKFPWRAVFLPLGLLVLLGLAFWNRTFFITCVIEPIARIFWLIYRTLLSVDQEIYWVLLILSALSLTIHMVPDRTEPSIRSAYQYTVQENDRVAYWETLLKAAQKSERDQLALRRNLEALQRSINAQDSENDDERILMPPFKIGFQQRIQVVWRSLVLPRMSRRKGALQATELEKSVDGILKSMETRLEIHHD